MDALRNVLERNRWAAAGAALAIGIGLGLLYAWVISPVEWVDGVPSQLREDLRVDYMRMAIDSYSVNRDTDLAMQRYESLGEFSGETLEAVGADPGEVSPTAIQNFRAVVEIFQPEETVAAEPAERPGLLGARVSRFILPVCGVTVLLGVLLAGALFLRRRVVEEEGLPQGEAVQESGFPAEEGGLDLAQEAVASQPLATFRTTYSLGDESYDDSFSIESPAGDFLGECGVGIGEAMGVGEPKKVSAFEVWLFDKNDIQTVTAMLMSRYAFNDETTRSSLAAKGEPVLAESGGVFTLETASLEVEARIVDLSYGEGPLPAESYFERMTIELRVWPRGGAAQ